MTKFTARTVLHRWTGESEPNNLRFETESLVDYADFITKAVEYYSNDLRFGSDTTVQAVTIETGAGMPDIGIMRDGEDDIEVRELNTL